MELGVSQTCTHSLRSKTTLFNQSCCAKSCGFLCLFDKSFSLKFERFLEDEFLCLRHIEVRDILMNCWLSVGQLVSMLRVCSATQAYMGRLRNNLAGMFTRQRRVLVQDSKPKGHNYSHYLQMPIQLVPLNNSGMNGRRNNNFAGKSTMRTFIIPRSRSLFIIIHNLCPLNNSGMYRRILN